MVPLPSDVPPGSALSSPTHHFKRAEGAFMSRFNWRRVANERRMQRLGYEVAGSVCDDLAREEAASRSRDPARSSGTNLGRARTVRVHGAILRRKGVALPLFRMACSR